MLVKFELNREPVASPRPRFSNFGGYPKAYFPKKYTVEKEIIKDLFVNDNGMKFSEYMGDIDITIKFMFPFPKSSFKGFTGKKMETAKELFCTTSHNQKPDLDNLAKTYLDALNEIAWKDDSSISKLTLEKSWSFTPNVVMIINYVDIDSVEELPYFYDRKVLNEKEFVNKVHEERLAKTKE